MLLTFIVNFIVGTFVGLSGIAGFLLPIFYIGVLNLTPVNSLSLSFAAFVISGILGSINYYKQSLLDIKFAAILSIGSFISAFLGVKLNLLIPTNIVNKILYLVVLVSGISILRQKNKTSQNQINKNPYLLIAIGFITGLICSISGAGGPILVLPILLVLGIEVQKAVAISLFNSIFIGLPASIGYFLNSEISIVLKLLPVALVGHGLGVSLGSKNSNKVNKDKLKKAIGIFSIIVAIGKLFF